MLAPYHDVGMTAIKVAAFGRAVNVTLGLPFPRTSPDHGTAFDIAGQGIADASSRIAYGYTWLTAKYPSYSSDQVRYATRTGASATISFTGTGFAWVGPVGPTRGTARVFIDGKAVANVDLRRSSFKARATLFAKALPAGAHVVKIVVTSSGRPVAIDELILGT